MTNARFAVVVVLLCLLWYTLSSSCNVMNKMILQQFPYPLTVTMCSLFSSTLYTIPMLLRLRIPVLRVPHRIHFWRYLAPLAVGKIIAASSAYISIWKVPVSFAHTVKASMPLFAVLCARIILKEHQTIEVYASLLPIICGVVIATLTELSFNLTGFLSALMSTLTYALLNTFVKLVLQETSLHHVKLLSLISQFSSFVFFPVWLWHDVGAWVVTSTDANSEWPSLHIVGLIVSSGFISFCQNLVTFTLIKKLSALSYAVANAAKRITVICVSLALLHNPVTTMNVFGMSLAVFGVLSYNRAKQRQMRLDKNKGTPLPMTMSDATLSDANLLRQVGEFSIAQDYVQSPLLGSPVTSSRDLRLDSDRRQLDASAAMLSRQLQSGLGTPVRSGNALHDVQMAGQHRQESHHTRGHNDRNSIHASGRQQQRATHRSPRFFISSNRGEDI